MFSQEKFSARITMLRVENDKTQAQVAASIGVARTMLTQMESGRRIGSLDVLCALADYFDVSLDYLVGRSDDPVRR